MALIQANLVLIVSFQMNELLQHLMKGKCQARSTSEDSPKDQVPQALPTRASVRVMTQTKNTISQGTADTRLTARSSGNEVDPISSVGTRRRPQKGDLSEKNDCDSDIEVITPVLPRRGRGRPRKTPLPVDRPLLHAEDSDSHKGPSTSGDANREVENTDTPPKRGRGRPRKILIDSSHKSSPQQPSCYPINRKDDYEALPMISAPTEESQTSGRQTRYSTGKIKRLDVAALLGRKIKDEPDDEEDYIPPRSATVTQEFSKRLPDEESDGESSAPKRTKQQLDSGNFIPRRRGRPSKVKQGTAPLGDEVQEAEEIYEESRSVPDGETNLDQPEEEKDKCSVKDEGSVTQNVVSSLPKNQKLVTGSEGKLLKKRSTISVTVKNGPTKVIVIEPGRKGETDGEVLNMVADALAGKLSSGSGSPLHLNDDQSLGESPSSSHPIDGAEEDYDDYNDDYDYEEEEMETDTKVHGNSDKDEETDVGVDTAASLDADVNKGESDANDTNQATHEENKVTDPDKGDRNSSSDVRKMLKIKHLNRAKQIKQATQRTVYPIFPRKPLFLNQRKRFHKCTICKQRFFSSQDEVKIHTDCHENRIGEKEAYKCVECDYKSGLWNRMLDHICTHQKLRDKFRNANFVKNIIGEFSCPICNKKFERKNNMKGHLSKVHYKQNRICEFCGKTLYAVDDKTFKRHVEKCQNLLFQCTHCSYKSPVSANMKKHMKIHLGQGFECEVCKSVFPSRQRYAVHRNTHNDNRRKVMCEFCGTEFMSDDAVKKHVIRVHSEGIMIHRCGECVYQTRIPTDLKKHITMVHNKKFKCTECAYQTNSETAFEQHSEYHGPGRQYVCKYEKCFYRGATQKQLSNHISQVHKLTCTHMCPICQKFYKKKTHLARHLVSHTGEKPYICLECGAQFSSHSTYYRHRNKTGHDAKREGIVSVPQNITIQYVSPDTEVQFEEIQEGSEQVVHQLETQGPEAIAFQDTGVGEEEGVALTPKKQNIIMLDTCEVEDGQPVTYLLRMGEDENGQPTMVTADGLTMDPLIMQQIQEQLAQMEDGQMLEDGSIIQTSHVVQETEVIQGDQVIHETQIIEGGQEIQDSPVIQEGQILPEGYMIQEGQVVQGLVVQEEHIVQEDHVDQTQTIHGGYMIQEAEVGDGKDPKEDDGQHVQTIQTYDQVPEMVEVQEMESGGTTVQLHEVGENQVSEDNTTLYCVLKLACFIAVNCHFIPLPNLKELCTSLNHNVIIGMTDVKL